MSPQGPDKAQEAYVTESMPEFPSDVTGPEEGFAEEDTDLVVVTG